MLMSKTTTKNTTEKVHEVTVLFQSELLELFPNIDAVRQHYEVLKFASGSSEQIGCFISQHHFDGSNLWPRRVVNILRENEVFSKDLFRNIPGDTNHVDIQRVGLSKSELQSLTKAIRAGKLLQLKQLDLRSNILSGCLKDLFGGPGHPGFPSLKRLDLHNTDLNQEDVESLSAAVRAGKLPQLKELNLGFNDLSDMEREVEALVAACVAHCEELLWLGLRDTGLSEEFIQWCRDKYRDVLINCMMVQVRSDPPPIAKRL